MRGATERLNTPKFHPVAKRGGERERERERERGREGEKEKERVID